MDNYEIKEIRINEMTTPMGLDLEKPVFSWIFEASEPDMKQTAARILVGTKPGQADAWDSGQIRTDRSIGIAYDGSRLQPCTRYYVSVHTWDQQDTEREAGTWFETGLMVPDITAWDHAKWIGAPEYLVAADSISVFTLESRICIEEGDRAGIVFGADDERLKKRYRNEMLLEGENFIRYVLNIRKEPASLEIIRVGYKASDREDVPLYVLPVRDLRTGENLITEENERQPHDLRIEVAGNGAYTWLDGHLIDQDVRVAPYGEIPGPRCLNPLGGRDVTTYPRLCSVGYYAGDGTKASFPQGIHIRNLREPKQEIAVLDPEGKLLEGVSQEVTDPSCHALPMLRREFTVKKGLAKARLYATARGIYGCRVNGSRIGDTFFAPGASQFDKHLMYQTYDLTESLNPGRNVIGCILASGWWSDSFSFLLDNYNYWGDKPSFLAKLVLEYSDGTREVIVTNTEEWDYFGEGPYRYAGFFNGEHYDARGAETGRRFFLPGFSASDLQRPAEIHPTAMAQKEPMFPGAACWPAVNQTEPKLVGHYQAPVRAVKTLTAKSMTEPREGVYIYDLGQEIAGVPVLTFHEKAGQEIRIRYGEMLYPKLNKYQGLEGLMLQANLREASSTDIYICSGKETEIYQPEFTFHGYRYIEITGVEHPPALSEVQSVLLSSVEKITGSFSCSDPLLNRFVENVKYSQYNNFISIPTDCPQRNERMGWLGDTHIFCKTANLQSPVKNFYIRNLQAMRDLQTPEGRLPSIAPFGGGFGGLSYESAMILIVWELYQQYGDVELIREYFPAMDAWMEAIRRTGMPGTPKLLFIEWLGDWLAPDPADEYLMFNAFHYRNARLMERFASLIGEDGAEKKYARMAEETKAYWNQTFVEPETGRTRKLDGSICDVQGSYAFALSCDVFAQEYKEQAYAHLARKTEEAGFTIRTGFFGTGPLGPMLSEGGYPEIAQKMITQTAFPSWLYPVTQGATTVWERWDSYTMENGFGDNNSMNSFDHYSLGSVVSWLYESVLGIRREDASPGFKHFTLRPEIGTFTYARGGMDTPHGRIESGWKEQDGKICYSCKVPANTTASVVLGEKQIEVGSGGYQWEFPADAIRKQNR